MKILFIAAAGFIAVSAAGQNKPMMIPDAVHTAFTAKFPGATNITWGNENPKEYEAEFNLGNSSVAANFKADGKWVVTETNIPVAALTPAISNAIRNKFPDAVISGAEKVEKPAAITYYEVIIITDGKKKEVKVSSGGVII